VAAHSDGPSPLFGIGLGGVMLGGAGAKIKVAEFDAIGGEFGRGLI
jgi:hypothetical protein